MSIDEATKNAIEAIAKARVAEALGGDVLGKLVDEVMKHTDRSTYGNPTPRTFFDKIVREVLEDTIRQTVRDEIASSEAVKAKLKAAIHEKAEAFAATVIDAFASEDWRATMTVTIDREK